jgi:pimeloyl-ACP methyl ester carboxylesterase
MGSRLYSDEECKKRVWEPASLFGLTDKINKDKPLYVHNYDSNNEPIDQNTLSPNSREVGANKTMKKLINSLCKDMGGRGIYVFNYDWRKSNNISAEALNEFINAIRTKTNSPKVDIVAHSMGGLVTSKYLTLYGDSKTEKIITCGTPYEGAPHLLEAIDTQVVLNNWAVDMILTFILGLDCETKRSFDGVAELTPTERYCQTYPMQTWNPDLLSPDASFDMTYQEYIGTLNDIFGILCAQHPVIMLYLIMTMHIL